MSDMNVNASASLESSPTAASDSAEEGRAMSHDADDARLREICMAVYQARANLDAALALARTARAALRAAETERDRFIGSLLEVHPLFDGREAPLTEAAEATSPADWGTRGSKKKKRKADQPEPEPPADDDDWRKRKVEELGLPKSMVRLCGRLAVTTAGELADMIANRERTGNFGLLGVPLDDYFRAKKVLGTLAPGSVPVAIEVEVDAGWDD